MLTNLIYVCYVIHIDLETGKLVHYGAQIRFVKKYIWDPFKDGSLIQMVLSSNKKYQLDQNYSKLGVNVFINFTIIFP